MFEEQKENEKEQKETSSEQLVNSASSIFSDIEVLELDDVKQKLLSRKEEIKLKNR